MTFLAAKAEVGWNCDDADISALYPLGFRPSKMLSVCAAKVWSNDVARWTHEVYRHFTVPPTWARRSEQPGRGAPRK
jgi:hypothetical protein